MGLIVKYVKQYIGIFILGISFLTAEAFCDLLQPRIMSDVVDHGVATGDTATVLRLVAVMICVALFGAVCAIVRSTCASILSQRVGRDLRRDTFAKVQSFSFENIDRLETGSIITRLTNDVTQVQNFINGTMRILVKSPIVCIGAIFFIVTGVPQFTGVMVAVIGCAFLLIFLNIKLGYPRFARVQRSIDKLNRITREFLSSIRVIRVFGNEGYEEKRFAETASELSDNSRSAARLTATMMPLISFTVNMGIIVFLWMGGYRQNISDIGKLMASVNYMTQIIFTLGMISNIFNMMVRAMTSSGRINEILDEQPTLSEPDISKEPDFSKGVEFSHVDFRYAKGEGVHNALTNICFSARQGQTIGIIGPTGSGKSTFANMIPRFYDVTKGSVSVGGVDVREVDSQRLRSQIALVPQKSILFTGTIAENLRWGKQDASDDEIREAARAACADTYIESFPEKYETLLGQGGVNLSGGQKQRLAIARALIKRPRIMILDDCTSALDATTERSVRDGIRCFSKDTLCFIITQRISSVMNADQIIVMDRGRINGMGTHDELMLNCKIYGDIYESQIGQPEAAIGAGVHNG